jgi:hypothetical protein
LRQHSKVTLAWRSLRHFECAAGKREILVGPPP